MSFDLYDASVPMFVNTLTNMRGWLDKAAGEKDEATLLDGRLAPDMRPLVAQYQMASDSAKNALARLTGTEAPSMPDTDSSFEDLRARCDRTIAYLKGFDRKALAGSEEREVISQVSERNGLSLPGCSVPHRLCTAELLLSRDHCLRDPASGRRVAGQA